MRHQSTDNRRRAKRGDTLLSSKAIAKVVQHEKIPEFDGHDFQEHALLALASDNGTSKAHVHTNKDELSKTRRSIWQAEEIAAATGQPVGCALAMANHSAERAFGRSQIDIQQQFEQDQSK
ncbi:hypothetical protein [Ensifer sp. B1-9]|uniref:hypothetical protein n=1 Tax=Ensifer sp. B1-9 TaxID=3141455 RepID=UPI003D1EEB05